MQSPLIELRNVDVALGGKTVLRDIRWALFPGQNWAILGANGSGKSAFLKLARAEVWPIPGKGERIYRIAGEPQNSAVNIKERIALVSPEMHDRYLQPEWRLTAEQVVQSGLRNGDYVYQKLDSTEKAIAAEAMHFMGVAHLAARDVQQLSTGELRKVLIARALTGRPRVLALDEACDGLDAPARNDLLRRIQQLGETGTQILFTTHRAEEIPPCCDQVLLLDKGRIAKVLGRNELSTLQPINTIGRNPSPSPGREGRGDGGLSGLSPNPTSGAKDTARTLVKIEGADVYLERRRVLKDINWEIKSDQHWAVLGRNGAGKSTLLKLAFGDLYPAWGGKVSRFEFTARNTIWQLRRKVGSISPDLQAHYRRPISGRDVVASGFFSSIGLHNRLSANERDRVEELLHAFGAEELGQRTAVEMSYGELRKLLLLRALVHRPELLICDEPFDGLDGASRAEFSRALETITNQANTRLVVVTHHVGDLPQSITHGLLLERGQIVTQGCIAQVRARAGKEIFQGL